MEKRESVRDRQIRALLYASQTCNLLQVLLGIRDAGACHHGSKLVTENCNLHPAVS